MARRHRAKLREAFKILGEPLFDGGQRQRYAKLESLGDPLARLNHEINWEIFRSDLLKVYQKERKSDAGRKPIDVVLMFKILILQRLYNLSDDQAEYQIRDRASFQRFLGIYAEDGSPDAKTIWAFREQLGKLGIVESIFKRFDAYLIEKGLAAKGGQIVDATIVEIPRQRNTPEENKQVKEGVVPESWVENPKKLVQKDLDARWTMKRDETFYSYKNHINVDAEHKFIRKYVITLLYPRYGAFA